MEGYGKINERSFIEWGKEKFYIYKWDFIGINSKVGNVAYYRFI